MTENLTRVLDTVYGVIDIQYSDPGCVLARHHPDEAIHRWRAGRD